MTRIDYAYLAEIRPESVARYLDGTGWVLGNVIQDFTTYHRNTLSLWVPNKTDFRDYGKQVATAVAELAAIEQRSTYELVADLRRA